MFTLSAIQWNKFGGNKYEQIEEIVEEHRRMTFILSLVVAFFAFSVLNCMQSTVLILKFTIPFKSN